MHVPNLWFSSRFTCIFFRSVSLSFMRGIEPLTPFGFTVQRVQAYSEQKRIYSPSPTALQEPFSCLIFIRFFEQLARKPLLVAARNREISLWTMLSAALYSSLGQVSDARVRLLASFSSVGFLVIKVKEIVLLQFYIKILSRFLSFKLRNLVSGTLWEKLSHLELRVIGLWQRLCFQTRHPGEWRLCT